MNTELQLLRGESSSSAYNAADDGEAVEIGDFYYSENFKDSAQ